jgi:hypothetical protein
MTVGNGGSFNSFDLGNGSAGQFNGGGYGGGGPRVFIE